MDAKHRLHLLGSFHKVSKFKLIKMGCQHFMTTRTLTKDTKESSCVYCGSVVRYEIPNINSLDRRSRIEDTIKKQNDNNEQKQNYNSEDD